jgi:hypothetical protein
MLMYYCNYLINGRFVEGVCALWRVSSTITNGQKRSVGVAPTDAGCSALAHYRLASMIRLYVRIVENRGHSLGRRYFLNSPFLDLLGRRFRVLMGGRERLDVCKESVRIWKINNCVRRCVVREA